jgi:hypothetical protein
VPVILGSGARLFDGVRRDLRFVSRESRNTAAVTHLVYDVDTRGQSGG